jgi:hypothetical protein
MSKLSLARSEEGGARRVERGAKYLETSKVRRNNEYIQL